MQYTARRQFDSDEEREDMSTGFFRRFRARPRRDPLGGRRRNVERENEEVEDEVEKNEEDDGFVDEKGEQKEAMVEEESVDKTLTETQQDGEKGGKDEGEKAQNPDEENQNADVKGIEIDGRKRDVSLCNGSGNGLSSASYSSSGIGTCGSLESGHIEVGAASCDELSSSTNHIEENSSDESLHADEEENGEKKVFVEQEMGGSEESDAAGWQGDSFQAWAAAAAQHGGTYLEMSYCHPIWRNYLTLASG